ncbi:MAG TPA: adenylate/guanylate cyclase domain-containing protein [Myxococcales bacterium]|nr:adenylate/guanylate cyclase domain-containing protein [Myxococcales bacterium]
MPRGALSRAIVADQIAIELHRNDDAEALRLNQEEKQALRQYVPGAIADELDRNDEIISEEREVSVLFADIRGYSSISENRKAEEVFEIVNRYTETVSAVVRRHGGSVVEFNGDGMMAVFGAPRELAAKEKAAVEAGRAIVREVGEIEIDEAGPENLTLSVGVGVATGNAFVGNIRAVDRMIWSAIGNTTNRAARLEGLTRPLDVPMVIDDFTQQAAGNACEGFVQRDDVSIKGIRKTVTIHILEE